MASSIPKRRFSPEQIIATLRQIEVQPAQSKSTALAWSRLHDTQGLVGLAAQSLYVAAR